MENELQIEKTYPYRDEEGKVKFVIGRFVDRDGNKTFKVASCHQNGQLNDWGLGRQEPILYNLPELVNSSGMVFIVEGEKDVDRLTEIGLTATTNPFGASKWRDEFSQYLMDRDVIIIPDNDEPGKRHASDVVKSLSTKARTISVIELPDLEEKEDVTDWLNKGHTKEELLELANHTGEGEGIDINELVPTAPPEWVEEILPGVKEGVRNETATCLVGRLISKGLYRQEVVDNLIGWNQRNNPPLERKELEAIVSSVFRTEKRNHSKKNQNRRKFKLITINDIARYQKPNYLIDGVFVEGTLNILGGYTGVGKSFVALSIIKSILTGDLLWGRFPVLKTGPVVLVDEENPKSLIKNRFGNFGLLEDHLLPFYMLHFSDIKLDKSEDFDEFCGMVEKVKPVLVVIDSLIRIHNHREKESDEMARVMDLLRKIVNLGTTVIVIHHHKKGEAPLEEKLRGSTDIPGAIDIEYSLTKVDDDTRMIQSVKTRIEKFGPIKLKFEKQGKEIVEISYQGAEKEILDETVKTILTEAKHPMELTDIHLELEAKGTEIGEQALRRMLPHIKGVNIGWEKRGKTRFRAYSIDARE